VASAEADGAPALAREALEAVIWRHLPPGTVYAAGRTDIILAAADAYAARGAARAREALGEMWWHLSPQPRHAGAEEVLQAADMYAAASVAAVLGALESPSVQAARRDELARAAGRERGHLELVAGQAGGTVAAAWAQCPCGREYDVTDCEGKRRCSECRRRQAREAMTRYRARKRAGQREAA
jgi:hypothetical protein